MKKIVDIFYFENVAVLYLNDIMHEAKDDMDTIFGFLSFFLVDLYILFVEFRFMDLKI